MDANEREFKAGFKFVVKSTGVHLCLTQEIARLPPNVLSFSECWRVNGCAIVLGGMIGEGDWWNGRIVGKNVKFSEGASTRPSYLDDKLGGTVGQPGEISNKRSVRPVILAGLQQQR